MRCKNCGWPNQPGETSCVKCHAPLEMSGIGTSVENYPQQAIGQDLKKTVLEANSLNNPCDSQPTVVGTLDNTKCIQCGFPLRPGSMKCPKCGVQVNIGEMVEGRSTVVNNSEEKERVNTGKYIPKAINSSGRTVNIYIDGFEPEMECFLKPVKRSNEKKELENIVIEGDEILLKRENTDPGNVTIATKAHAIITHEDDKWYIIDKSETNTTFVRAGEKTVIEDGSLILLGNRLFEFHVQ